MKEFITRAISGAIYAGLLLLSLKWSYALIGVFFVFGIISLMELNKLIQLKNIVPFIIFSFLYISFGFWDQLIGFENGFSEAVQILQVITIFVLLLLIKDLFSEKQIPLFEGKRYIISTFYLTSGFVFLILLSHLDKTFTPLILLGCFILVWINDSFAYLVGKNFGKQKLFPKVSPKKTVEGFLGGLFFACITSYFLATFTETLDFTNWLILAIIVSVFGTLGDLIESKFKRQAGVKDSGVIMPGHGGLLDRLDSIIFASPFIYVFLRFIEYVS